jgi:hypothetical protein
MIVANVTRMGHHGLRPSLALAYFLRDAATFPNGIAEFTPGSAPFAIRQIISLEIFLFS